MKTKIISAALTLGMLVSSATFATTEEKVFYYRGNGCNEFYGKEIALAFNN